MIESLLLKLNARDRLTPEEEESLREMVGPPVDLPPNRVVVRQGDEPTQSILLLDGLMCRYKDLRNGGRQISELNIAGDFVDLHSFTLKRMDHSVMTLSPARVTMVQHQKLEALTDRYPHLTRLLWFSTNLDAAIHREWMLSLGRRSALERAAHFFCELHVRLDIVGAAQDNAYPLPITQTDLAECLGLTPVHVNRVLRALREQSLVTFRSGRVIISDMTGLRRLADFNPSYLLLERRSR